MVAFRSIKDQMDEFCRDVESGSFQVMQKALAILRRACDEPEGLSTIRIMVDRMRTCHGDMALIIRAADRIQEVLLHEEGEDAVEKIKLLLDDFSIGSEKSLSEIKRGILSLVRNPVTVITISRSSSVIASLSSLKEMKFLKRVIVCESRPMMEGVQMARELSSLGIDVTLIVDAAMGQMIGEADVCIIGADSVDRHGNIRNKIGSRLLALLCREYDIPMVVACQPEKIVDSLPEAEEPHNPREVIGKGVGEKIDVVNYYFENVPRKLIDYIVLGKDVIGRDDQMMV